MKVLNQKRNILLYIVSLIAVVMLALALIPGLVSSYKPAHAEGNNAGSGAISGAVTLEIDVNGKDPLPTEVDNNDETVNGYGLLRNNARHFRSRNISSSIAATWFKLPQASYSFDNSTIIRSSNAFEVTTSGTSTMLVTAKEITEEGLDAYFSIVMYTVDTLGNHLTETRVYFKVVVHDTFVQRSDTENIFYVGYKTKNGVEVVGSENNEVPGNSYEGGTHAPILSVPNNSTFTVNLGDYLLGRALYNVVNGGADTKVEMTVDGTPKFWTLNSVKNMAIKDVSIRGLDADIENAIIVGSQAYNKGQPPIRIAPSFTGGIHLKASDVEAYNQSHPNIENAFWNTTHTLAINLYRVGNSDLDNATIYIPFTFAPANPQNINISSDVFRLNISSQNTFDIKTNTYIDGEGGVKSNLPDQRAIIIRPEDLLDYAMPGVYHKMTFTHVATELDGVKIDDAGSMQNKGISVTRLAEESDAYYPNAYRIEADTTSGMDGTHNIKFTVNYYDGPDDDLNRNTINVEIDVEVYGGYSITFRPLKGKRAVAYNALTDDVFSIMRDRGYMLTKAESSNPEKLAVDFANNVVTLSPQVKNVTGEENVPVILEFTNYKRQKITITSSPVNIDVNAGSLFARFDDWEAGLIIAAICLAGLIIILFIVWMFIRAISKRRQEELATQAPVSSYIVKLNSTIAQTQAQQRAAQTQALAQASQMLLGAGPTGAAAPLPDTLALASGSGTGAQSMPGGSMSQPGAPLMSEPQATVPPDSEENYEELIAKYITDEELLERIFTEKYEPKGMVRRTFFKSKDLQARELDKEKKRIIERYKTPMPMDEAIMSESEIQSSARTSTPSAPAAESEPQQTEMFVLDFDPDSPLYVEPETVRDEFSEEKIDIETSPEEKRLRDAEHSYEILQKELAELENRIGKVSAEVEKAKSLEDELREKIAQAEADDAQYGKDIEDLEFRLASAKNKDKPTITRDIGIKEEKKKRNLDELERLRAELDKLLGNSERLGAINDKLDALKTEKTEADAALAAEIEKARKEFEAYQERLAQVRAKQELEAKVQELNPMLVAVNEADYELKKLQAQEEARDKERESLKDAVAAAKAQIMSTSDFGVISDLNMQISDANTRLSDLEKEATKATKRESELNIEFNACRRKANEFIEKNDIPLEEVIKAEDVVIGNIELELLKAEREKDKEEAEKAVAESQAVYDDLSASSGDVALVAMDVAAGITDIEEEIATAQTELDDVNLRMETASEDEKLMLIVEQGDKADKVEELKAKLEQANVEGTKRKMEAQAEYDAKLEEARKALEAVNDEFSKACSVYDDLVHNTNPVDLIVSGSGPISRDQKIIEAENLKKQLERQKNEIEQARLAAQQAQEEAERVRIEAERAAEEARLEAERNAQEAVERAEQARLEAEEKARAEVEAAERAKQEAEEAHAAEVEEAKRKAEEEAEEARRKAQEESEEARLKALEESEEAKRKAEEEAEEAKRKAQEEIEEMRRKAEEEAEAKRIEEENRQKEEAERQKADAERNENIAKKIAMRKEQIIAIRNEMKELKGDEDAKHLRERLYNIQLTYDEDERGSTELMDFYNKTMDDIQNAGEIARLKAENAKKPQRVVRKVTERVNRTARRRPRPGARPGARRPGARPGARPAARPGARPGARPAGARPAARPGARPGARPAGVRPAPRPGAPTRPKQ